MVGTATMLPVDFVLGRGTQNGGKPNIMDEGLVGNGLKYTGAVVSGGVEYVGKGAGATVAVAATPAKDVNQSEEDWIKDGAKNGGSAAGNTSAHALGTGLGAAMNVARIPSVAVKYALKGTFAFVSGTIGFFVGAGRAIANR